MRFLRNFSRFASAAALLALAAMQPAHGEMIDLMYVGDGSDNSPKVFAIKRDTVTSSVSSVTASFMGTVVKSQGGLHGPRGLLIVDGNLLVSDQNSDTSTNGDISLYDSATGKLLNRVVSHNEPNAPAVPRGIITFIPPTQGCSSSDCRNILVADFSAETQHNAMDPGPGRVRTYSAVGAFIGDLPPPDPTIPMGGNHDPTFHIDADRHGALGLGDCRVTAGWVLAE
jgi:hypothetical protein